MVPHDTGDPLLVTWILWWSTHAVPLTAAWWNAPAFYPATGVFAFSESLLGLAPLTAPIIALTHSPLAAYNAAFLVSYLASGLGAYFLAFVLTRRHDAAFVAGVAFAFAPYRLSHTQHLQLLSSYWMPVAIAALHRYPGGATMAMGGALRDQLVLQALACGYYLFFLTIFVLFWLAWFAANRLSRSEVDPSPGDMDRRRVPCSRRCSSAIDRSTPSTDSSGARSKSSTTARISPGLWSVSPDSLRWGRLLRTRRRRGIRADSRRPLALAILGLTAGLPDAARWRSSGAAHAAQGGSDTFPTPLGALS